GEPLNHIRDQSGLAVPAVVIARLGQGRYVLEVRQLLLERVQLGLEAEILLRSRAVEEGGLAVQAALGHRPQQRQYGRHARPAAHEHQVVVALAEREDTERPGYIQPVPLGHLLREEPGEVPVWIDLD